MESKPVIVDLKSQKPVVWKILVGVLLVYINMTNFLAPAPNLLKAETPTEQTGMNIAYFAMIGVGCWLIYSGVRPVWRKLSR